MLMMKCVVVFMGFIGFVTCCHNITEKDCPKPQRGSPCVCNQLLNRTDTVVCCNINNAFKFHEGMACGGVEKTTTKHLHIFNYTVEIFDANSSKWWHLESLSVTRGKFKNVTGQFGGDLKCINFSNNSLLSIENNTFTGLSRLNNLDISANNLTRLPFLPSLEKRNLTLDVSGNQLLCKNTDHLFTMEPFNNLHFNRRNNNETFCFKSTPIGWFLSKTSLSLDQMLNKRSVEKDCPRGPNYQCNCSLVSTTSLSTSDSGTLNIDVDCAGRFLTELPKPLPSGTIKLDVSNNNITSLDEFVTEPTYSTLKEFLADNNKIASIKALEGSKFFNHFSILSLKDNQLRSIPTYLLSNAFDSLWDARHVKLGGNRLNCDCNTAQSVKVWLNSYSGHIPDYMDIFCAKEELGRVIDLDMNQVCIYQKDWTDYIYYIIAGEILLLILLFSKVTYDYWVFKTAGYLPWPASKMPKLPCDWVFET